MTELPVIESCDGCGACCYEVDGYPPFKAYDVADVAIVASLPDEALALLEGMPFAERDEREDTDLYGEPCAWLNMATKRCRFYEHRPTICREFDRGSVCCRAWREEALTP